MLKSRYGWSDASFNEFLRNLAKLLAKGNKVPANTYYAKKLISPLIMVVKKIDTCRNHCILYRGDYKDLRVVRIVVRIGTRQIKAIGRKRMELT